MIEIRKGQAQSMLARGEFHERFMQRFFDPAYDVERDVAGVELQRRNLADWLEWMGLVDAGSLSQLERYIGYYEPYWNSHEALDRDQAVQTEARSVAKAVVQAVALVRRGALDRPDEGVLVPRRK